ncbi:MAG TPA: ABC transporter ATP-binding protein [Acidimicrobiia bacterium]|jgi:ATP-binding cassette subfamily B protein|nr:ABC transporter ATP-binding protein [Acidimicrobiia bacterium]
MRYGGDHEIDDTKGLLMRAARLGRHLRRAALWALFVTIIATVARLLGPIVVGSGVDEGIAAGDKRAITIASLVFLGLLAVQYWAQRVSQFAVANVGERFLLELRSRVFNHLTRLDMAFYDGAKTGVLVSRMTSDIESITEFTNQGAVLALTNLLTTIGVAVAMLLLDLQMALAVFVVIGVVVLVSVLFQRHVSRAYQQVRESIGRVLASLQEGITGVRVVQAFTQETEQAASFGRINETYFEANMTAARAISWYFPAINFLRTVGLGVVLLLGGRRVISGDLTFGSLVAFTLYLNWFFEPIVNLANVYNLAQASLAALAKLFQLLDVAPKVQERPDALELPDTVDGALALEAVGFGYGDDLILEDFTLDVPPGQRLAVVGETGAGKSTVAKLLMRFYDPSRGAVRIDGIDLRDLSFSSRAEAIALIPQDGFLFDGTLRDNFRYAVPEAPDQAIWDVCRAMGIDEWVRSLPEGLDTEVRERGSRFSAGERQLVALGRAFLADPAVVVLDEATSNLDPETEVQVEGALRVLLAERTAVVIAHRLRSAERADRVVMVDAGRIIADGSHDALVETSDRYRELVEVWERGVA